VNERRSSELHLRQSTLENALIQLDKFINGAFMAGLNRVKIIHGKGSGTLRRAVQEQLSQHSLVGSYYLADHADGGVGVTIVELVLK
jgi:DNA mismatch repair protein MutS2